MGKKDSKKIYLTMKLYITITPFFPEPDNFRGPFVYDQVKAIEQIGKYDNSIVFKPKKFNDKRDSYIYDGIKVILFPTIEMPSYILNGITNGINCYSFRNALKKNNININDIAVVHGHTSSYACYGVALKKINPQIISIVQHHDPDPFTIRNGKFSFNYLNLFVRTSINRKLFNKVDLHVSVSKYVEENLLKFPYSAKDESFDSYLKHLRIAKKLNIRPIDAKNSLILYNGVDTSKFYPTNTKKCCDKFIIGCVANFIDWKDQITLIKAVEILKNKGYNNILVRFIGSGATLNSCKEYVENNNLTEYISFETEIGHRELNNFYNSLDLFVLPSFFEGFGCVFAEAHACGVPFIAVKEQGISELIPEKDIDKWLIDKGDFISLSNKIENYINNRYKQELTTNIDINYLVGNFLDYISKNYSC